MALENFLWEFGCKDEEWLKPKKNNHEPCDGVVQQEDIDMLRNVQVRKYDWVGIRRSNQSILGLGSGKFLHAVRGSKTCPVKFTLNILFQGPPENMVAPPFENPMLSINEYFGDDKPGTFECMTHTDLKQMSSSNQIQSRYNLFGIQVQRWRHCCYRLSCNCWWLHCLSKGQESYWNQPLSSWYYGWWCCWLSILGTGPCKRM